MLHLDFCGYGQIKKWHAPDHTKIETFRSRLTAKSTGYALVFGFNSRQLTRYIAGEVRSKIEKMSDIAAITLSVDEKTTSVTA